MLTSVENFSQSPSAFTQPLHVKLSTNQSETVDGQLPPEDIIKVQKWYIIIQRTRSISTNSSQFTRTKMMIGQFQIRQSYFVQYEP